MTYSNDNAPRVPSVDRAALPPEFDACIAAIEIGPRCMWINGICMSLADGTRWLAEQQEAAR